MKQCKDCKWLLFCDEFGETWKDDNCRKHRKGEYRLYEEKGKILPGIILDRLKKDIKQVTIEYENGVVIVYDKKTG